MRFLDADHGHEGGDVIGEQFGRIGAVWLVGFARPARIERNASEMLGVVGDLERVAGVIGCEIRDEDEGFARPLGLVIDRDVVDLDLGHGRLSQTASNARRYAFAPNEVNGCAVNGL